jgi:predicted nuclease of restriction endonuclease-like (RecB) superfamily
VQGREQGSDAVRRDLNANANQRKLKYMRAFAEAYPDEQFVQQVVPQLPWGHNVRILAMVKDRREREWYIRQAVGSGWILRFEFLDHEDFVRLIEA